MNEYSLQDLAAVAGSKNDDGWGGGSGALWMLLLIALLGGFGNNRGFGGGGYQNGAGFVGGNELYPWLNQNDQINSGFRDQMINGTINGIQQGVNGLATQLCECCGTIQMALANGFAGVNAGMANGFAGVNAAMCNGFNSVNQGMANGFYQAEIAANGRQMADMNQRFADQTATMQGFNGLQAQVSQVGTDNILATANQTATILAEHCSDRAALSDATRDIIQSQTASTQSVLDKLCALELDGYKSQLAQAQRENVGLQNQLNMANLAASQIAQTSQILQGQTAQADALYNRFNTCPVPSMPVYGRTPIFTCQSQTGCGCGM